MNPLAITDPFNMKNLNLDLNDKWVIGKAETIDDKLDNGISSYS